MNQSMQPWKSLAATVRVGNLTEGWTLDEPGEYGPDEMRVFRLPIPFVAPFAGWPVVHLSLTGFDIDQRDSSRLTVRAVEITPAGFVAEIATWRETRVYSVELSWLALGA